MSLSVIDAAEQRDSALGQEEVFYGTSPKIQELLSVIDRIAESDEAVLIEGETGVGKEFLAREIHLRSHRARRPMLKLSCRALSPELVLEPSLAGWGDSASIEARRKTPDIFDRVDGGTMFLDEVGEMDARVQATLFQVLEDRQSNRLFANDTRMDFRIIAATHQPLATAVARKTFREDLYYRLNVIDISVPPLRECKEDILPMAEFFMRKWATPDSAPITLTPSLEQAFLAYHWPGNARELENTIRKLLLLRSAALVERDLRTRLDLYATEAANPFFKPAWVKEDGLTVLDQAAESERSTERALILDALRSTNWNRRRAALLLKINYRALLHKMKKLSIGT
jgi:two-component system, NtrC family, response regulator AtoC